MLTLVALLFAALLFWFFEEPITEALVLNPFSGGRGRDSDPGHATACFKGSPPPPPKAEEVKLPPLPAMKPLPPPPRPPPPPTTDMSAVDQASQDAKRKLLRQNGLSKTLLAGETGGYQKAQPEGVKKTLLG